MEFLQYYDDAANVDNELQNKNYNSAMSIVNKYSNRVEFITLRTSSEKAITYLKGRMYDFLYLDGRHDYISVKKDINLYFPIISHGGILAGHDYKDENRNEWMLDINGKKINKHKAVKSAVNEFSEKHKLNIITTNEADYKTWMIGKP